MSFDELKNIWNDSFEKDNLSSTQIRDMLRIKKSSSTALVRILINYRNGLLAGGILYIMIMISLIFLVSTKSLIFLIPGVTALLGISFGYVLRSYLAVKRTQNSGLQIKEMLEKSIAVIEKYVSFNLGTFYRYLLIPIALILGIIIGLFIASGDNSVMDTICALQTKSIIKIIAVIVFGTIITIYLSKNIVNRLYQQHLDELKRCLEELKLSEK
jgi:hypothetical protein